MSFNIPEMPQHLILALDHHRHLIEDARRQREIAALRRVRQGLELPLRRRGRGFRLRVGDLLANLGRRVKATPARVKTVWG